MTDFNELIGKTLKEVDGCEAGSAEVYFETECGNKYQMYHSQGCCESVYLEDVCGDVSDIVGSPILSAEEVVGETAEPAGWVAGKHDESYTWTFYKIDTAKGGIALRWFGSSNGAYSESVDFELVDANQ